ncbi:MAG TPA: penicillin-binding protein [Vicinamibacterales bacterium]
MTDRVDPDLIQPGIPDRNVPRLVADAQESRREARPAADWRPMFRRRLFVFASAIVCWMAAVEARLFYLQVVQHDELLARAERQQQNRQIVHAPRGDILDRYGNVLAMSGRSYALQAQRSLIDDPEAMATKVCAVLDRCTPSDRAAMARLMRMPREKGAARFVYLRREISDAEAERIMALEEPTIMAVQVPHRYYPGGPTGAHVVGFVNIDNVGQTGVEYAMNSILAGKPGAQLVQVTPLREHRRIAARPLEAPVPGASVETTLDRELQYMVERALADAVAEHGAKGGVVIVMDPFEGDILAMANSPTFDPNEPGKSPPEYRQNRAAQHIYEPGSTFKSFIAAAALEVLRMPTTTMFDVSSGYIQFGARRIRDDHRYNTLSFTDVIVKSSNVGAIKIGLQLGPEVVSRYVSRFGFGETFARDIPHQRAGLVDRQMANFGPSALASVSMGYQIGVTPLQMATAVSAIANGGELVVPRVVRATISDGTRTEIPRRVVRRAIPPEVAAELTTILEQVVERGTATRAKIEGYTIAGKTGTAAKLVNGRYSKTEYNASFVGFVPSRQPRAVILALLDSPRRHGYYGGVVAAPLFKAVAEATLRRLGVPPNVERAPTVLAGHRAEPVRPVPAMRTPVTPVGLPASLEAGVVPDVRGLSAREAVRLLGRVGVQARLSGDGFVARQSLEPGSRIEGERVCVLTLTREPASILAEGATQP